MLALGVEAVVEIAREPHVGLTRGRMGGGDAVELLASEARREDDRRVWVAAGGAQIKHREPVDQVEA